MFEEMKCNTALRSFLRGTVDVVLLVMLLFAATSSMMVLTMAGSSLGVDPVVVGRRNGTWYKIAEFDLTEAEEYGLREFSRETNPQ